MTETCACLNLPCFICSLLGFPAAASRLVIAERTGWARGPHSPASHKIGFNNMNRNLMVQKLSPLTVAFDSSSCTADSALSSARIGGGFVSA